MARYYDLVLGLIPLALVGISAALVLAGMDLTTAVPLGAVVSVGLIGHAMFVRAPVDPEPRTGSVAGSSASSPSRSPVVESAD